MIFSLALSVNSSYYSDDLPILYTQITQISWPPNYDIDTYSFGTYTKFLFETDYEIINNGSKITVTVHRAPYFIPMMNASLVDSSLNPGISYVFVYPVYDAVIKEGISKISSGISFSVGDYSNQSFPLGNYTFWFDAPDLKYDLQLIPFYTTINITENQVIITHQGTNEKIIFPEQTTEISFSFISSLTVLIILIRRKRRK